MESYEEIYKYICRVCLSHEISDNTVNLIDISSEDGLSCYGKSVITFANILIKIDDYFPTTMCKNCLILLKQAIRFKLMCESNDKLLKSFVNFKSEEDSNQQDFKVKLVEYTMFMRYFPEINTESGCTNNEQEKAVSSNLNCRKENPNEVSEIDVENNQDNDLVSLPDLPDDSDKMLDKIEDCINMKKNFLIINGYKKKKKKFKYASKFTEKRKLTIEETKKKSSIREDIVCKICNKVLSNKFTFKHHMQRHNGCQYICEHCGKGFPVLASLHIHQVQVHGTGKCLICKECGFKAPRKYELLEHERLHTGERPFACDKCGLTFRRRFIWKKHLIYHMEKTVQCPQCPKKFFRRVEMLAHSNNIHERMYVYLCNKCGATYAKASTVRRHLTDSHGIPREEQGKITRIMKGKHLF